MRPRVKSPLLAMLLMIATVLTSFPPVFAGASNPLQQQSSGTSRPKRGKNGDTTRKTAEDKSPQSNPATQPRKSEPVTDTGAPEDSEAGPEIKDSQPPQGSASDTRVRSQQRPEPPPFDRPPIGSSPGSASPSRDRESQAPARTTQPRRDEQEPQQTPTDDGTRRRPTLQRDPDAQREPVQQKRKPVLRRSTDPEKGPGDESGTISKAEPADTNASTDDETIKLDATLVNIPVLVSDRSGRYISQLSERDFVLYEDGVQQEVAFFGSEEVPFNVALVLDMSPSVAGSVEDIHDAAIAFVRQLRSQDRVMVVSFDRDVQYLTDFTNDRGRLESAIRSTQTGSGTSVYDAVYQTVTRRLKNIEGRKALILFSDGEDTSSKSSYDEAVNIVSESDVLVYGLRYPGNGGSVRVDPWPRRRNPIPNIQLPFPWPWPRRRRGNFSGSNLTSKAVASSAAQTWGRRGDFMTDITNAGGGPVYDAEKISDMKGLAFRIADELRHVYVVSYYPSNSLTNGGYREIRIRVKDRDGLAVRHRKGYNAREMHGTT